MLRAIQTAFLRLLRKRPGFLALNVLGLAIGMASCFLIGLFIQNELSYDRFHENADRIYRVVQYSESDSRSRTGDGIVPILRNEIPEITSEVRVFQRGVRLSAETPGMGRITVDEDDAVYVDAAFFEFFDFSLLKGSPAEVLKQPASVVLTSSAAEKYFGTDDVIGKTMILDDRRQVTVTGVAAKPPLNSHLQFDVIVSLSTFYTNMGYPADALYTSFFWPSSWIFVELDPSASLDQVNEKLDAAADANRRADTAAKFQVALQPLTDVHLYSGDIVDGPETRGDLGTVYVFGAIALFILLIACINFVNLATSQAVDRAKEVGVRKSLGAPPSALISQFLGESMLVSAIASVLALGLTGLGRPVLTSLLGRDLAVDTFANPWLGLGLVVVVLITGLGAGAYPAFFLSRYRPSEVLKDAGVRGQSRGGRLRQSLVVFQFAVSVALIVASVVAYQQLSYMQTADLGFEDEQVVTMDLEGEYTLLAEELKRQPGILAVTAAESTPGMYQGPGPRYEVNGVPPADEQERLGFQNVDFGFFEIMDVELLAGRVFEEGRISDLGETYPPDDTHLNPYFRDRAYVINRALADKFGWTPDEAIGQRFRFHAGENNITYLDTEGRVVGVIENYHTRSLRQSIDPMAFQPSRYRVDRGGETVEDINASTMLVKVAPGQAREVMRTLQSTWKEVLPGAPFEAAFLDETLDNLYEREGRISQVVALFSLIAILVACLGLFGLATYTVQQRTREVGIRKALGASVPSIIHLVSKDFLKLVALAVVLAAPVAYYVMGQWLQDFAYRISLGAGPLTIATVAALVIAVLTVSTQAFRAARIEPAKTLRQE